jgi:NADH-quinone oxidoreductase subunit C
LKSSDEPTHPALRRLLDLLQDAVVSSHERLGDATVRVEAHRILDVMTELRDDSDLRFDMLMDLTAVDHLDRKPRFDVVYHLYSLELKHRLRVIAEVSEDDCRLSSVVPVWPAANWPEREVFDLYGVVFDRHPDLRRLLLYDEFEGHPLRKDYPKARRQPLLGRKSS